MHDLPPSRLDAVAAAHLVLAETHAADGDLAAAVEALFSAREISPDAGIEARLGDLLRRAGRPTEAAAAYRRALKLGDGSADTLRSLSAAYRDCGRPANGLAPARRAVELAPNNPWMHVQLGNILARLDRPAEAATAYGAAQALDLHLPGVARALGEALLAGGAPGEAIPALALAAAEDPQDIGLMLRLAALHEALAEPGQAVPWYRRAAARGAGAEAKAGLRRTLAACGRDGGDDDLLRDALHRIPVLAGAVADLSCTPLTGGLQNAIWQVRAPAGEFVLRLERFPAAGWDFYAEECRNAAVAHRAGLTPEILFFDQADGTMLSRFVVGRPLDYATIRERGTLEAIGAAYRTLHAAPPFFGGYDIFQMIDINLSKLAGADLDAETRVAGLAAQIEDWRAILAGNGIPQAPCHNDPVPANFIDTGDGVVMIDWQCSGQADPDWEVGALSAQANLDESEEAVLLAAVYGEGDHPRAWRARLYKLVCRSYWLTLGLARRAEEEPAERWQADVETSGPGLIALLADPGLPHLLAGLRAYRQP